MISICHFVSGVARPTCWPCGTACKHAVPRRLDLILWAALVLVLVPTSAARGETPVVLENEFLRVEFSATDGSIMRLTNKARSLELISVVPQQRQPWALLLAPLEFVTQFSNFQIVARTPAAPSANPDVLAYLPGDSQAVLGIDFKQVLQEKGATAVDGGVDMPPNYSLTLSIIRPLLPLFDQAP